MKKNETVELTNDLDNASALEESLRLIEAHLESYPLMTAQDAAKLLYQSEFGCGHFAPSPERARKMLEAECAALKKDETHPFFDVIGGGFVRLHLEPLIGNAEALDALADAFVKSAETPCGSMEGFKIRLDALKNMAERGKTPFSKFKLAEFLKEYEKLGCPAVHHSETYRENYHPAYRVIKSEFAGGVLDKLNG